MTNYINSDYVENSTTDKILPAKPSSKVETLLEKPVDDSSLKKYGLSKPKRIKVKARVIHDQS